MNERTEIAKREENAIEKNREIYPVAPGVDIYENEEEILLYADMPGVIKKDITVNIDNGTLSISGIRKIQNKGTTTWEEFGDIEYVRNFSVPPTIDVERVEADLKDGVLKLHMPKSEAAKPRRIEIKTA